MSLLVLYQRIRLTLFTFFTNPSYALVRHSILSVTLKLNLVYSHRDVNLWNEKTSFYVLKRLSDFWKQLCYSNCNKECICWGLFSAMDSFTFGVLWCIRIRRKINYIVVLMFITMKKTCNSVWQWSPLCVFNHFWGNNGALWNKGESYKRLVIKIFV